MAMAYGLGSSVGNPFPSWVYLNPSVDYGTVLSLFVPIIYWLDLVGGDWNMAFMTFMPLLYITYILGDSSHLVNVNIHIYIYGMAGLCLSIQLGIIIPTDELHHFSEG